MADVDAEDATKEGHASGEEKIEDAAEQSLAGVEVPKTLREDQIQNAVSFLSHPKVQGSSEQSKRAFLEKKGLTEDEIQEAFSRNSKLNTGQGAISSTASPAYTPSSPPPKPYHGTQATIQALQPRQALQTTQAPQISQSLRWTQVVLGASIVVAGAYALKQLVQPVATKWYRQFYGIQDKPKESIKQDSEEKKTAEIVAKAIELQTTELTKTVDSLKEMVGRLEKGKQTAYASSNTSVNVDDLRSELHAFASTLTSAFPEPQPDQDLKNELAQIRKLLTEKAPENAVNSPKPKHTSSAYPPYSGMNGTSRVGPPAARAHSNQPLSPPQNPRTESTQPSYMEVLEMLERGETPPNVRTDINDKPPNPNQAPPSSHAQPRLKPWERSGSNSSANKGDVRGGNSSPNHTVITELDDDSRSMRKGSTGAWRPPPVPQASIRNSNPPSKPESEIDASSVHSADKVSEAEE